MLRGVRAGGPSGLRGSLPRVGSSTAAGGVPHQFPSKEPPEVLPAAQLLGPGPCSPLQVRLSFLAPTPSLCQVWGFLVSLPPSPTDTPTPLPVFLGSLP